MSTRTEWVDYAKAIGIILVVFGHVNRGIYDAGFGLPESIHSVVDSVIYSFHMPLFFSFRDCSAWSLLENEEEQGY